VPAAQPLVTPGWLVRAHAIADPSSGIASAYVHRYDDHGAIMSGATITLDDLVDEAHEGLWVDPKSGATVSAFEFGGPRLYRTIPPFVQDIALLVRPDSPVQILTTSIPAPDHQMPYHHMLAARGGGRPYTWSITSGALPVGMALDAETGLLSGTPRYGGSNQFTVSVIARPLATGGAASFDQVPLSIQWSKTFPSVAGLDGAIVESAQGAGVGGIAYPSIATEFGLGAGDTTRNQRIVTILSFDTESIPNRAVIDSARVVLTCNGALRGDPLALGPLYMDVNTGAFGASARLELGDFQSPATAVRAAARDLPDDVVDPPPWSANLVLDLDGRNAVNRTGMTQCRVDLAATDFDGVMDDFGFCPGEYPVAALRPRLVITYH
jgi:hypothetical protein